jgi:hypothetical protein
MEANRPERYRNAIVPHIYVDDASGVIAFYERVRRGGASQDRLTQWQDFAR